MIFIKDAKNREMDKISIKDLRALDRIINLIDSKLSISKVDYEKGIITIIDGDDYEVGVNVGGDSNSSLVKDVIRRVSDYITDNYIL
ncbi:hypothetical protein [uncultured Treponema sp.]|uniref:hypothetical protein n=1 Tax=uncultured Treponema sp. TaxID=162155 RepID=UPI0025DB3EDB|nr:hypothetical protein [uncultured Treponema sp.]